MPPCEGRCWPCAGKDWNGREPEVDEEEVDDMASGGGCDIQGREGNVGATKQFKRIPVTKSVPRWTVIGSRYSM
jgi:hypothetical protein